MNLWLLLIAAGLATFATRLSFIFLIERLRVPDWFRRSLRFVPVAVLSAIALPELIAPNATWNGLPLQPQFYAGLLAILVAWRTKNVLLTIGTGMAMLLALRMLLGAP
ncbi:MAG: AzlD domain-containing protein [Anaerolineales bacterium]|nr:AzlD domain-containing protein [Anaerolineales bacterium]